MPRRHAQSWGKRLLRLLKAFKKVCSPSPLKRPFYIQTCGCKSVVCKILPLASTSGGSNIFEVCVGFSNGSPPSIVCDMLTSIYNTLNVKLPLDYKGRPNPNGECNTLTLNSRSHPLTRNVNDYKPALCQELYCLMYSYLNASV